MQSMNELQLDYIFCVNWKKIWIGGDWHRSLVVPPFDPAIPAAPPPNPRLSHCRS